MDIFEFKNRVMVNVTAEEYEHIEAVYMASDLDKDEFCAMWRKMNKSRVAAAKAEAKRKEVINRVLDSIMRNMIWHGSETLGSIAVSVLTDAEIADIKSLGIEMETVCHWNGVRRFKYIYEIKEEILNRRAA